MRTPTSCGSPDSDMTSATDERPLDTAGGAVRLDWAYIRRLALEHKGALLAAHITAVLVAVINLPVPLLLPMLVDEVILGKRGPLIGAIDGVTPAAWHRPVLYVGVVVAAILMLRALDLALSVLQDRQFSRISKDMIFRMRALLLKRLERMEMRAY